MAKVILNPTYPDFTNYYYGPKLAFEGISPYLPNKNLFTPTTYPPTLFPIFKFLSYLDFILAGKIWTIGSIFSLLLSLIILLKIHKQNLFSNTALLLYGLTFLSFPIKFSLGMGQINLYILLLIVLFIYFLNKGMSRAGAFLSFAIILKLFPVFLIPYLVILKKWKILLIIFSLFFTISVITYLVLGREINIYYIQKIAPTLMDSWKGDYYSQSLSGLLTREISDLRERQILKNIISAGMLGLTFILLVLNKDVKRDELILKISTLINLNVLINGFSWQHHFVWMIIPLVSTFFYIKNKKLGISYFVILLASYILISFNFKDTNGINSVLLSHVFYGGVILWILQLRLISKGIKKIL